MLGGCDLTFIRKYNKLPAVGVIDPLCKMFNILNER